LSWIFSISECVRAGSWTVFFLLVIMTILSPASSFSSPFAPTLTGSKNTEESFQGETLPPPVWKELLRGLELTSLPVRLGIEQPGALAEIVVVRIDPAFFDIGLFSRQWDGGPPRTLEMWAQDMELAAAINAAMYLPDGRTGTGYMRRGENISRERPAKRFGAFFVAGPLAPDLPRAAVLDRTKDDWERLLPLYETVVQNFRLMGHEGEALWPENGPSHAVASVAEDREGRILFLHCRQPITIRHFAKTIASSPELDIKAAMYVEGGAQAAMLVRGPGFARLWTGSHPADFFLGAAGRHITLPNILGARVRADSLPPDSLP